MFLVSGPDLVIAACRSGVVGCLPSGMARTAAEFEGWVVQVRNALGDGDAPFACNLSLRRERLPEDLEICRRHAVPIIISAQGDPGGIVQAVHAWSGLLFHDVTTLAHARKAIAAGVDGLVAIGAGGGGHSGIISPMALIPQIRAMFDGYIIAAGAIGDGSAVLAAQSLGADFAYIGTRFIATRESLAPDAYKGMLVDSASSEVMYIPTFTHGVPANFMARSIKRIGLDPTHLPPSYDSPDVKPWRDIWAAGHAVGLIEDVPPVAELVDRLAAQFAAARTALFDRTR
jgi:nitronate monooxygenase